ncbi:hypothetical protein [Shewanella sp. HN-41]|uniref:hypothetical protein n=1 Tax=Shewanella sp. HN-41 TaxID=327275 RepID=UPI0002125A57|nr:hypothetical protein [Shewanella sp. HN-41]EGM69461.1 secreted protein [Shewanella sp. HN-41]
MKVIKISTVLLLISLLAACATQTLVPVSVVLGGNADSLKNEYFPIEPLIAKSQVEISENGQMVEKDIRTLSNAQKLGYLGDTRVVVTLAKETASGELSYLTGKVTGEKGKYVAFMDYANFFIDDLSDGSTVIGRARVGVGLRLVARIQTNKKGIDLGSILKIGFAANKSELSGELEVRAIGVTSKEIQDLLPGSLPNLDESSIQRALEAMAAVKTKIHDPATSVQPRIMAVALNETNMLDKAGVKPEKG